MNTKMCSRCKEDKDISEFKKHERKKDGLQPYCITCASLYYQERKLIKEQEKAKKMAWMIKNGLIESEPESD